MAERASEDMVIPNEFPELKLLAWNRDPARPISAAEAFALYERNWRFVDADRLTEREARLIECLSHAFGHGHVLGRD